MAKAPFVSMLTDRPRGSFYVGVTANLPKRIWEHKNKVFPGYTAGNNLNKLVWFEQHSDMRSAIRREKAVKKWSRMAKFVAVERSNREWRDSPEDFMEAFC